MKASINQKALNRIRHGHPWIFRSDLVHVDSDRPGPVDVLSPNGKQLGQALYSPKSLIALRMMTEGEEKITESLIRKRMEGALAQRQRLYPDSRVYRLIFAEADALPSLLVDRYEDVLVFQTLSAGMDLFKDCIVETLKEMFQPRSIIERNEGQVRQKEGLLSIRQVCHGIDPGEISVEILGKHFCFSPLEGQKTGFFLDQRFNAFCAASYLGGEILDVFSNGGQFAVHAAGKAVSVECVDIAEPAVQLVRRNAELNGADNIQGCCENAFDYLKARDQEKRKFDSIILDPPAFVKSRSALANAVRGYKEINLRAMRLLKPGGILVTCSCSQNLSQDVFEAILRDSAMDARRRVQVLERRGQPADHPWLLGMPETEYLKCYILRVE
jgi:23S rRNA (cytosine1962-C5)-methyltransferase